MRKLWSRQEHRSTRHINPYKELLLQMRKVLAEEEYPPIIKCQIGVAIKNWNFYTVSVRIQKMCAVPFMVPTHTLTQIWQRKNYLWIRLKWKGLEQKGFWSINVVMLNSNELSFLVEEFRWKNTRRKLVKIF